MDLRRSGIFSLIVLLALLHASIGQFNPGRFEGFGEEERTELFGEEERTELEANEEPGGLWGDFDLGEIEGEVEIDPNQFEEGGEFDLMQFEDGGQFDLGRFDEGGEFDLGDFGREDSDDDEEEEEEDGEDDTEDGGDDEADSEDAGDSWSLNSELDIEDRLFPSPGEIFDGISFEDVVSVFSRVAKSDTILLSAGILCENIEPVSFILPQEVFDVCGFVVDAVSNDRPITGVEEFCDEIWVEDEDREDDDLIEERTGGVERKRKRRSVEDEDSEQEYDDWEEFVEDVPFSEFYWLREPLREGFGFDIFESNSTCMGITDYIRNDSQPVKDIVRNLVEEIMLSVVDVWAIGCYGGEVVFDGSDFDFSESESKSLSESESLSESKSLSESGSESGSGSLSESGSGSGSEKDYEDFLRHNVTGGIVGYILNAIAGYEISYAEQCSDFNTSGSYNGSFSNFNRSGSYNGSFSNFNRSGSYNDSFSNFTFLVLVDRQGLAENLTVNLLSALEDQELCIQIGRPIFGDLFGIDTEEMCWNVVNAFNNSGGSTYIDIQDILDKVDDRQREEFDESGRQSEEGDHDEGRSHGGSEFSSVASGWWDNDDQLLHWYSLFDPHLYGPFAVLAGVPTDELINLFGRMYSSGNSSEAMQVMCDSFNSSIIGGDLEAMCVASKNRDYGQFEDVCQYWGWYGLIEVFDWGRWEDRQEQVFIDMYLNYWHEHENYINEYIAYDALYTVAWTWQVDLHPFGVCDFFSNLVTLNQTRFRDGAYQALESLTVRVISWVDEPCWIATNDNYTSVFDYLNSTDQEPIGSRDVLLKLMTYLTSSDDPAAFCRSVHAISSNFYDIEADDISDMLSNIRDKWEDVLSSEASCGEFFEYAFANELTFDVYNYTGFQDVDALCVALVDAFLGDGPSVDWEVLVDQSFDADMWDEDLDWQPGMVAPGVSFKLIVSALGTVWNGDVMGSGLGLVCTQVSPLIAEYTDIELGEIQSLCDSISEIDFQIVRKECDAVAGPLFQDEDSDDRPMFRDIDSDRLKETLLEAIGLESFEKDGVCPGVEAILNRDISVIDFGFDVASAMFDFFSDYIYTFCTNRESVVRYIIEEGIPFEQIDNLVGIATNMGGVDQICDIFIEIEESGDQDRKEDMLERFKNSFLDIPENVDRCSILANEVIDLLSTTLDIPINLFTGSSAEDWTENPFYWITGVSSGKAMCAKIVEIFTGEVAEVCRGIVDCAGVCNGDARPDCEGTCNGEATFDCARSCNGGAYINNCTECVAGRTGRPADFGTDRCGECKKKPGYRENWDCYGTCDGFAFIDRCGECVGGASGSSYDTNEERLDCRGVCDGGWVRDTCNYCEPAPRVGVVYSGGSKYKDCTDLCIRPGVPRAEENDCGVCVGGATGLGGGAGQNVCGQCESDPNADETSCAGCDGVPNSGAVLDTCGVCGGDGTDCVGVGLLYPNIVPNKETQIFVIGAGFTAGADLSCLFTGSDGQTAESDARRRSVVDLVCEVPVLSPGDYEVGVRRNSDVPTDITATLRVFADIDVLSLEPESIIVNRSLDIFEGTITVASGAFSTLRSYSTNEWTVQPALAVTPDDGFRQIYYGVFDSDETVTFSFGMPFNSMHALVSPSLNGGASVLGEVSQEFFAYFEAPSVEEMKFSPIGASIFVTFDKPVDYESLRSCGDIFASVSILGAGARCRWLNPTALIVFIGKGDSLVEIGGLVQIKADSVRSFRQDYSQSTAPDSFAVQGPDTPLQPVAILSGPPKLPSCGNIQIDARRSTGSGGRQMTYTWSVSSSGSTTALDSALASANSDNPSSLALDGDLMVADTDYVFTVSVTNFLGGSHTASLTVHRTGIAAPEVKILSQGVDLDAVRVSDSFELTALVKFYSECVPAGATSFEWSVDNSDVPLNLKTQFTRSLYIPSSSLPGGETITFTVRVYKSDDPTAYVEATIQVVTISSPLVAVLKGGSEITVGRDSGTVELDGSLSYDPDEEARDWVYEWQCLQTTDNSACWSYDSDSIGTLINNGTNVDGAYLTFTSESLQADKVYLFTLIVSKLDRSSSTSVIINAVNGAPPQIVIPPRRDNGVVKDTEMLFLSAFIEHATDLINVTWETTGTESGFGFIDFEASSNFLLPPTVYSVSSTISAAVVGLLPGVVSRGTTYSILITANTEDVAGVVKTSISVLTGPTSCEFNLPGNYTEFDEVIFSLENCVSEAEPLKYQLFVEEADGSVTAFKDTTSEPTFTTVGAPRLPDSTARSYVMKVCDANDICSTYEANSTVLPKATFSTEEVAAYLDDQVNTPKFAGDFSLALTNLNMVSDRGLVSRRRRREASEITSSNTEDQLELIQLTLDETVLTTDRAQLLLDQTASVDPSTMSLADQSDFVDQLETIIDVFISDGSSVPTTSAETVSSKLDVVSDGLEPVYNAAMLSSIKSVRRKLSQSIASSLSVGSPRNEISGDDGVSGVLKTLLSDPIDSKSTGTPITMDFGSELAGLYGAAWTCSSGSTCSGVTVKINHYNSDVDYLSTSQDDIDNRAADILGIELADPESDATLNISGLSTPVELGFTLSSVDSNVDYECVYWTGSAWSADGIVSTDNLDGTVTCATDHLTEFTVMGVPRPTIEPLNSTTPVTIADDAGLTLEVIIIIGVGSFFGVIILLLSTVFLAKHCSKEEKVSPAERDEELQAMEPQQQQQQQQQQQPPIIMAVGIPVMAAQGYNQPAQMMPMGGPMEYPAMPTAPMYNMPALNFSQPAMIQNQYGNVTAAAPPAVTMVGQNNNLVQVGMSSEPPSQFEKKSSSEMTSFMGACTTGLPGVGITEAVPMKPTVAGSKASLTGHF